MATQMTFNNNAHLELSDVEFTEEEMDKINSAGEELFKSASRKLTSGNLQGLSAYWADNAKNSREMANTLSVFCPKNIDPSTQGYVSVKEAMTKAMVMEKAISLIGDPEKKASVSLDRLPGESAEEHRARLRAYLSETE